MAHAVQVTRSPLRSSWAHVLLVRLTAQVIAEDSGGSDVAALFEYLESCLRHKSEVRFAKVMERTKVHEFRGTKNRLLFSRLPVRCVVSQR